MNKWQHKAPKAFGGYAFDYGFIDPDGDVEHGDHAHGPAFRDKQTQDLGPMTVIEETTDDWTKENTYDKKLWCVVCRDEEH